jgi:hypothetical protein
VTNKDAPLSRVSKKHLHGITTSFAKSKTGVEMNMKIPALTDLAKDVKKIAEALTKIADVAERLADNQQGSKGTEKEEDLWM